MKKILISILLYLFVGLVHASEDIDKLVEQHVQQRLKEHPEWVARKVGDIVILEEREKSRSVVKHKDGSLTIR